MLSTYPLLALLALVSTLALSQSIYPGSGKYSYAGCWNETAYLAGSSRALPNGNMQGDDALTPERCLTFCAGSLYAGLEYERECWCGAYLSGEAERLPDSACDMSCKGDPSKICGGRLRLTLYNQTQANTAGSLSLGAGADGSWSILLLAGLGMCVGTFVAL